MSKVERANRLLDALAAKTGLTEDGKNWLIAALDPMHDERLQVNGYPDRQTGASVVQVVKRSFPLRKPASWLSGPWNLSVIADNDMYNYRYRQARCNNNTYQVDPNTPFYLLAGGCSAVASQAPAPYFPYVDGTGNTFPLIGEGIDVNLADSKFRVLSVGLELVNTTPELYKSGSICVWEQPLSVAAPQAYLGETITYTGTQLDVRTMILDTVPPATLPDALLLQGSQQWKAADGAYLVLSMCDLNNPPKYVDTIGKNYITDDQLNNTPGSTTIVDYLEEGIASTLFSQHAVPRIHYIAPFSRKGCYLAGLSDQTTFTINYNIVIETFPTSANTTLITLATPTSCEDQVATSLYSHIMCRMPVGVQFKDNDMGEWFLTLVDGMVNVAESYINPVLKLGSEYKRMRAQATGVGRNKDAGSTWTTSGKTPSLVVKPKNAPQQQQQKQSQSAQGQKQPRKRNNNNNNPNRK